MYGLDNAGAEMVGRQLAGATFDFLVVCYAPNKGVGQRPQGSDIDGDWILWSILVPAPDVMSALNVVVDRVKRVRNRTQGDYEIDSEVYVKYKGKNKNEKKSLNLYELIDQADARYELLR